MKIRVEVSFHRWSGHGEGGTTVSVKYEEHIGHLYNATPADIKEAERRAAEINKILEDAGV